MIAALAAALSAAFAIVDVDVEVGDGTVVEGATVVVDGGVVVAVARGAAVPAGAFRVDGKGKVLSPGLFAAGSQLGLFEVGLEDFSDDDHLEGGAVPGYRTIDGFNPLSPHIAVDREEGVTTVLLSPGRNSLLSGQGFVVELSSRLDVDASAARAPAAFFGSFDGFVAERWGGSRAGMLLGLREIFDDARFYRTNRAAFDRGDARTLALAPVHLRALQPLLDGRAPLVVEVDRASDIRALLAFAREQKIKLVVDGGAESWLVAAELRDASVPVIVRPSLAGQVTFDGLHARDDLAKALFDAGVTIVISSWDTQNGTTRLRQEAGLAVQNGLPHAVALAAITGTPARIFGAQGPSGPGAARAARNVVKKGAPASLVLWSGDPLEALTLAERVWVDGVEMKEPSRQRQLAEKYKPKQAKAGSSSGRAATP